MEWDDPKEPQASNWIILGIMIAGALAFDGVLFLLMLLISRFGGDF